MIEVIELLSIANGLSTALNVYLFLKTKKERKVLGPLVPMLTERAGISAAPAYVSSIPDPFEIREHVRCVACGLTVAKYTDAGVCQNCINEGK